MELKVLMDLIKLEADRLQAEDGLSIDAAYEHAVAVTFKTAAEKQAMSPFEARILAEVRHASRGGRPIKITALLVKLETGSRYSIYYHLRNLERRGLVYRPGGARSKIGWLAE